MITCVKDNAIKVAFDNNNNSLNKITSILS